VDFYSFTSVCCLCKFLGKNSDRPKTFSAEYSAENYRTNIRPKRIFGKCCRKRKESCLVTFYFQEIFSQESKLLVDLVNYYACMVLLPLNHAHQLQLAAATLENHFCLIQIDTFTMFTACAEYSLSAEYSLAFSCQIFVFGRNKKIRFRSIARQETT
jgi:hypothetical protein